MADQTADSKPYDSTFKALICYCAELLVALINYAFGEQFDLDTAVTFLQSEVFVTDKGGETAERPIPAI